MRNSRSGAPSNLDPRSSRSSLRFLSVKGTVAIVRGPCGGRRQQERGCARRAGVVADVGFSARIKGTDNEIALDYSQASLIEDGKVARIKEFREHPRSPREPNPTPTCRDEQMTPGRRH